MNIFQYASMDSGGNVCQYDYNATRNDQWYLEADVEDGVYIIKNKQTGLYLTVCGNYVKQQAYSPTKDQQFKITSSSNGYYDIAPVSNLDWSIGIDGWDMGYETEGALIIAMQGQSQVDERWRFLLNSDGTYRIVSECSDCEQAISVASESNSYLFSYAYDINKNANWELIRIDDIDELNEDDDANMPDQYGFIKEGRHVIIELDSEKYLEKRISPENLTICVYHKFLQQILRNIKCL